MKMEIVHTRLWKITKIWFMMRTMIVIGPATTTAHQEKKKQVAKWYNCLSLGVMFSSPVPMPPEHWQRSTTSYPLHEDNQSSITNAVSECLCLRFGRSLLVVDSQGEPDDVQSPPQCRENAAQGRNLEKNTATKVHTCFAICVISSNTVVSWLAYC